MDINEYTYFLREPCVLVIIKNFYLGNMANKLIQRLIYFVILLLILNVITVFFISEREVLKSAVSGFTADGRMNTGTELILRDNVDGIAEEGTFEHFSNEAIRLLMEEIELRRMARTVVYRPEPVSPDTLTTDAFELNLAIESRSSYIFFRDITLFAFNNEFEMTESRRLLWFFKWRNIGEPVIETGFDR